MGKVTKAEAHLSVDEVKTKIKETVGFWRVQKWLVILNALIDPRPAGEIAKHTGLAVQTVHNIISSYNRFGASALEIPGKGGRFRSYLSTDEEKEFLETFIEKAIDGQVPTIAEIKTALEKHIGHSVHKTTVYRLLKRNGWRKITPRPFHVNAKKKEQERFKKTSRKR